MASKRSGGSKAAAKQGRQAEDSFERPAYDEKGYAKTTAPNKTDAEGVDSSWQAPTGVDPRIATPHTTPEVTDPNYQMRRRIEAQARGEEIPKSERPPQVLITALDVKRGEEIYRIPAGTVVEDAELEPEEWDQIVRDNSCREASISEYQASERRKAQAQTDEKLLEQRKKQLGVRPAKASASPPQGATLIADLREGAAEVRRATARRERIQQETTAARVDRASMTSGRPARSARKGTAKKAAGVKEGAKK